MDALDALESQDTLDSASAFHSFHYFYGWLCFVLVVNRVEAKAERGNMETNIRYKDWYLTQRLKSNKDTEI